MTDSAYSRRTFIQQWLFMAPLVLSATLLNGCSGNNGRDAKKVTNSTNPCEDFSGVSEKDLEARKKLGYVKDSPIAESTCSKCNLFLPAPDEKPCGGCMLFKGPVNAGGYCTYWTAKQG